MWLYAVRRIPRIEREEWDRLDGVARWLIVTRAAVLVMTVLACALAGLLALRDHGCPPLAFAALTLGLTLAHATNNILNDYTDHKKGVDRGNYFRTQYGPQPLEQGLLSTRALLGYAAATGALAIACGGYFVWLRGGSALALAGVGAFFVLFYTWPLKHIGMGEPAVLLVWGPLMVGGGYFMLTGRWSWGAAAASVPYALGPTCVIFGKHIDKLTDDTARKIRTLPVVIGERAARLCVIAMTLGAYATVVALVAARYFAPTVLAVGFALPATRRVLAAYARPRPEEAPRWYPKGVWPLWFVAHSFVHARRFGALFLAGVAGDLALRALGWW